MADEVRDVNIEKGVHLSVVVEFCVQNVIVVCLKNKGKEFKGVLLESDGGFFPFSFPFLKSSFPSLKSPQKAELPCPSNNDTEQPGSANKNGSQTPEAPATTQRFSYNHDPFLVNPTPTPALTVVEMKPIAPRTKTIRDIRLRPRQTLCSNCKSAIHEGRKTRGNASHCTTTDQSKNADSLLTTSTPDSRLRPRANGTVTQNTPLKPRPAKRKSETQTPMVLLEDIKHKSTRFSMSKDQKRNGNAGAVENEPSHTNKSNFESSVESLTNTTNRLRASRRSLLSEANINHEVNVQVNGLATDYPSDPSSFKSGKKTKSSNNELSTKPSPAIKISIKGGAILKIPPRLPESGSPSSDSISEADKIQSDIINSSQFHKKAKKSAKRAKDRHRSDSNTAINMLPNGDQPSNRSLKKHKKKHRHRHQSPGDEGKTSTYVSSALSTYSKGPGDVKTYSQESNNFDDFAREPKNINTFNQGPNNVVSFKQESGINSTFTSETNNTNAFRRELNDTNISRSRETNDMDALRYKREVNPLNSSFSSGSNNVNTFYDKMNNTSEFCRDTNSTNVYRQTLKREIFPTETSNYCPFSAGTDSSDIFSRVSHVTSTSRPLENNNVVLKVTDTMDNLEGSTENYFNPYGSGGNIRQAISPMQQKQIRVGDCFIDVVDISDSDSENELQSNSSSVMEPPTFLNSSLKNDDLPGSRPRLLYTWKQDQGLARVESDHPPPPSLPRPSLPPPPPPLVPAPNPQPDDQSPRYLVKTSPSLLPPIANSPHRRKNASPGRVVNASTNVQFSTGSPLIKDYPLRNRTGSLSNQTTDLLMIAERGGIVSVSEDSQSHSSGLESRFSDISGESDEDQLENIFAPCGGESISQDEDDKDLSKPLMLKIQTQNVTECVLEEGRRILVGDIIWGKIQGFPWWPGRVSSITVTRRDNNIVINQLANIAWFGSNTMSHVHCCDLFPFLEDFKIRFNKKKKGPYKMAIKQATQAAHKLKMANGISHGDILDFTD